MRPIRHANRAVLLSGERILLIRMKDSRFGDFYVLPGGGQNGGETMHAGLVREVREELGIEIEVGRLLYVREYIGRNHDFSPHHHHFHQVETVFLARIISAKGLGSGRERDRKQIGFEWVPLAELSERPFLPKEAIPLLQKLPDELPAEYLGDIN